MSFSVPLSSRPFGSLLAFGLALLVPVLPLSAQPDDRDASNALDLKIDREPIARTNRDRPSYAPIVDQVSRSVVSVHSTRPAREQRMGSHPLQDDPMFRRFFGQPGPATPPTPLRGLGSGVVVTSDGYILTNNHVIEGADEVQVSFGESTRRFDAEVIGGDALADVAVLKIEPDEALEPMVLADSEQLHVGDQVLAIGNPFGVGRSVTSGIVSAIGRGNLGIKAIEDFIQTDAAINRGNSGGALIDIDGRLVGINTAILSGRGGAFSGVGFAIPINLARGIAEQLVSTGEVTRGFLGVTVQELTPDLATQLEVESGALVADVSEDSPAAAAGLEPGDVITRVNDTPIRDGRHLLLAVSQMAPESEVDLKFVRNGESQSAETELEARPDRFAQEGGRSRPGEDDEEGVLDGVAVSDLTPRLRSQLQVPDRVDGAVVARIDPTVPAARQGLRRGDLIVGLNRQPVENAAEAVRISEQITGSRVLVRIWREGRAQFLVVDESEATPEERPS